MANNSMAREAEKNSQETQRKTLFVRNLPYTTSDKVFEDAFSEYGPIKRCFVVKDKDLSVFVWFQHDNKETDGTNLTLRFVARVEKPIQDKSKSCRGFGYVTFVICEDAKKARESTISIGERKVQCSFADKKPRQRDNYKPKNAPKEDDTTEEVKEMPKAEPKSNTKSKPKAEQKTETKPEPGTKLAVEEWKGSDEVKHGRDNKEYDETKRTVVVTGLNNEVTKSKLKVFLSQQGKVEKIQFPAPSRDESTALVTYKSIKGAVRAFQKLPGTKFGENIVQACLLTKEGKQPPRNVLDKSKLIVRNLSFKCKKEDISKMFEKYGRVLNVELPTKIDARKKKKLRGFGFVQFANEQMAKAALDGLNKEELLGRPMIIDWAVPKEKFVAKKDVTATERPEKTDDESMNIKSEKTKGKKKDRNDDVKNSDDSSDRDDDDEDDANEESEAEEEVAEGSNSSEEELDGDDEDKSDESGNESDEKQDGAIGDGNISVNESEAEDEIEIPKIVRKQSHDVKEGRTIFIRNLPFETTEEDLEERFSRYGPIHYCKVVIDPMTGHSRGSGFIKFKEIEAVDAAIAESEAATSDGGIKIEGRRLVIMKAVTRGKVKEIEKEAKASKKDPKDKRNLHLANEGVIFPNSEAAKELSEADLKKRDKAWTEKKAKLKNQNYFISKTRLCVRNLPLQIEDKDLRQSFIKAVNKKDVKIKKVRIMRSKERVDQTGKGRSLGYAFVEFETHEHALATLRATNNNPDIFGDSRRPIVEFAVENKVALDLQEKRRGRQKQKLGFKEEKKGDLGEMSRGKGGEKRTKGVPDERKEGSTIGGGGKVNRNRKRKGKEVSEEEGEVDGERETGGKGGKRKRNSESQQHVRIEEQQEEDNVHFAKKTNTKKNDKRNSKKKLERNSLNSDKERMALDMNANEKLISLKRHRDSYEQAGDAKRPKKVKKASKKPKVDQDEAKFNSLVNDYKAKLFGTNESRKRIVEKRWFE